MQLRSCEEEAPSERPGQKLDLVSEGDLCTDHTVGRQVKVQSLRPGHLPVLVDLNVRFPASG